MPYEASPARGPSGRSLSRNAIVARLACLFWCCSRATRTTPTPNRSAPLGGAGLTAAFVYFFFRLTVSFVFAIVRCLPFCSSVIFRVTGSLPNRDSSLRPVALSLTVTVTFLPG